MSVGVRYATIAAMLVSPIAACAIVAAAVVLIVGFRSENWGFVSSTFLMSVIVASPLTLVLGPVTFQWMQRRRLGSWYHYAWTGGVIALLAVGATLLVVVVSKP